MARALAGAVSDPGASHPEPRIETTGTLAAQSSAARSFAVGDIVRLNSDRVHMTVRAADSGKIGCQWHNADDDLVEFDFDPRELTLVRRRASEAS
jgi:uncharacterized protein YodC (DUF2158 family)